MTDVNKHDSWEDEDAFWRTNYRKRPYASGEYSAFQPGYRYGYEAAQRYRAREWDDVEEDLSRDWDNYEHRGSSTWQEIKDAVRDAWDRVTGKRTVESRF